MSSITLSAGLGAAIGGLATAPLGVPQIFYVPAVLTGLGTLGMVYVAYRCKPSSVSFVISGPPGYEDSLPSRGVYPVAEDAAAAGEDRPAASPGKPSAMETTTVAEISGAKAMNVPHGSVDQPIR